jgi:hypothetical protein
MTSTTLTDQEPANLLYKECDDITQEIRRFFDLIFLFPDQTQIAKIGIVGTVLLVMSPHRYAQRV